MNNAMDEDFQTLTLNPTPSNNEAPAIAPIPLIRSRTATSDLSDREVSVHQTDYEISEESRLARDRHEKAVQDLLSKRRAFAMAVPTNDAAVRSRLRRLGEPVTLFGEREMERRDRLREIMLRLDNEGHLDRLLRAHEDEQQQQQQAISMPAEDEGPQAYPFFTEGAREILDARMKIAKYSLVRGAERLERTRRRRNDPDEDEEAEAMEVVTQAGDLVLDCSEIGDDRPLTGCSFSRDGMLLATWYCFSWSFSCTPTSASF